MYPLSRASLTGGCVLFLDYSHSLFPSKDPFSWYISKLRSLEIFVILFQTYIRILDTFFELRFLFIALFKNWPKVIYTKSSPFRLNSVLTNIKYSGHVFHVLGFIGSEWDLDNPVTFDHVLAACEPELMPTFPEHRNLKRRSDQHESKYVPRSNYFCTYISTVSLRATFSYLYDLFLQDNYVWHDIPKSEALLTFQLYLLAWSNWGHLDETLIKSHRYSHYFQRCSNFNFKNMNSVFSIKTTSKFSLCYKDQLTCLGCLRRRTRSITNEWSPGCSIMRCCHGITRGHLGVFDNLVGPAEWWTSCWAAPWWRRGGGQNVDGLSAGLQTAGVSEGTWT